MAAVLKIKDLYEAELEYDEDWAAGMQHTLEDVMAVLDWSVEESVPGWEDGDELSPSGYPYCGCYDCVNREMFYTITVLVARGIKDGKVRLADG